MNLLPPDPRTRVDATVTSVLGLAGAYAGWDFGAVIGGPLMGVVASCNTAVIAVLLGSALLDRLWALRRRR